MSYLAYIKKVKGKEYAFYPFLNKKKIAGDGHPEEKVRMDLYNKLLEKYKYPPELVEIEFPVRIRDDEQPRYADIVVFDDKGHKRPLVVVEAKSPKREDGEKQGQRYATILRAVYVLWSNGENESASVIVNRYPEESVPIKDIPEYGGKPKYNIKELTPFEDKRQLSSAIRKCHNHIRSHDKKKPAEAFMEFLKIMLVKLEDEFNETDFNMQIFFRGTRQKQESSNETAQRVRALFHEIIKQETSVKRIYKEDEDINLSNETIYQIVALLQSHSFSTTDADIKASAFETFLSGELRKEFKEFMTPREVVGSIIQMAQLTTKDTILDPCCGTAAFLIYSLEYVRHKIFNKKLNIQQKTKLVFNFAHDSLWGFDDSPEMALVSKLHMRLNDDGRSHIYKHDSLNRVSNAPPEIRNEKFNYIFTNPPFGTRITGPESLLQSFKIIESIGKSNKSKVRDKGYLTEVLFLERNLEWLLPGGEMFIVLPDSVLNNTNLKKARAFIEERARVKAVISLPADTFGPSGAKSKTSVVLFKKWSDGDEISQKDDMTVFIADIRNIGYDFTGRRTKANSELPNVVNDYISWNNSGRKPVNKKICKLIKRKSMGEFWVAQSHFGVADYSEIKTISLGSICSRIDVGKTAARSQYTEKGVVIVKVGNLSGRGISYGNIERQFVTEDWAKRHNSIFLQKNDVLFTAAAHGPKWIGLKVDIYEGLPKHLGDKAVYCAEIMNCRVNPDSNIDPYYILLFLRSSAGYQEIQRCIRGQSGHIYPDEVSEIKIPHPDSFSGRRISSAILKIKTVLKLKKQSEELEREVTNFGDEIFPARGEKPIIAR